MKLRLLRILYIFRKLKKLKKFIKKSWGHSHLYLFIMKHLLKEKTLKILKSSLKKKINIDFLIKEKIFSLPKLKKSLINLKKKSNFKNLHCLIIKNKTFSFIKITNTNLKMKCKINIKWILLKIFRKKESIL